MSDNLPTYLKQGEIARLFPVLSTTSKEGRTTSIVLACMTKISEFGSTLLKDVGQRVGTRAVIESYTEIVFDNNNDVKDRPDGLIVLKVGRREWRALIEAKVGNNELNKDQIERYRELAKNNKIDCVITISNQFATSSSSHPLEEVRKSRSKIPVFHWSWMHILTTADLLINRDGVADADQLVLLNELRRFLSHESAGIKGFERMPREWVELNKLVSAGGVISAKSQDASIVLDAWHQETRDMAFILSRLTETIVSEKLPRNHADDPTQRRTDEMTNLRNSHQLKFTLIIPDSAAQMDIVADLKRRSIDVGMTLRAPEDKVSTKARINWLLRQIRIEPADDLYIRLFWPGRTEPSQFLVTKLRENVEIALEGRAHLTVTSFHIFTSTRTGSRFTQQANFIADLEQIVPDYYRLTGSDLVAWQQSSPKINDKRASADDVSTNAISEKADEFEVTNT